MASETLATQVTRGMRRMLLAASLLVFSIGIPLFLLTTQTELYFAWTIKSPITAAFLGACYWASGVLELAASRERYWDNARATVPAVWAFTSLTLLVTFLHWDRFHFSAPRLITVAGTWVWVGVYFFVPILLGYLWFRQARQTGVPLPPSRPFPAWIRGTLGIWPLVMLPLGAFFLLVPSAAPLLWPWDLTPLTARATGAWLIGWGVLLEVSAKRNDLRQARAVFFSLTALSLLQFLVLIRYSEQVNWSHLGAWLWLLFLITMAAVGIAGLWRQPRGPSGN